MEKKLFQLQCNGVNQLFYFNYEIKCDLRSRLFLHYFIYGCAFQGHYVLVPKQN